MKSSTLKHTLTIMTRTGEHRVYEWYPQLPRRDYKFISVVPTARPTMGQTFALECEFERWLAREQATGQQKLL
jgi:hypothetical protein